MLTRALLHPSISGGGEVIKGGPKRLSRFGVKVLRFIELLVTLSWELTEFRFSCFRGYQV